jgi:hypothetical protein
VNSDLLQAADQAERKKNTPAGIQTPNPRFRRRLILKL